MMVPVAGADFQADPLEALDLLLSYNGGTIHMECWSVARGSFTRRYQCERGTSRLAETVNRLERDNAEVLIPLPRVKGHTDRVTVLWARVEGKAQERALQGFRPVPTMILSEGHSTRKTALWWLRRPIGWKYAVQGNDRIAHKLRSPRKYSDPDGRFKIPAPGTCLRKDRKRPVPILVDRLGLEDYTAAQVVGRDRAGGPLPDAPDKDAWRS